MGLKNQKSCALEKLFPYIPTYAINTSYNPKLTVKNTIRDLADEDECFENMVFEIGCEILAKEVINQFK